MTQYRKYNWPELFAAFEQSGLSQVDFCKQHNLNAKYFSLKLANHKSAVVPTDSAFTRVTVVPELAATSELIVAVGHCKIYCPNTLSVQSIVNLVKALA